uniref:XPGN domain-containing protein n=1 Tax=Angiostrongylus cantonensis TaxID=6313 RepID=A0A0K0D5R0_ANGCA
MIKEHLKMDVVMIADIAWIQRGVAKRNPDKIRLDNDQLKQLIEGMPFFVLGIHKFS